jgi:hypothetical protein
VVIIMAVVPKTATMKGGITAFICPNDAPGVVIETRNAFMGLRGIENSVTRLQDVFVPNEAVVGGVGKGLKLALATLNTGRLSLPAIAAASTKYALKISREWANERKQWGMPIGKHDPVAQNLAFVAGTAFGLEAVVDVSSRLADDKRNDFRVEAALAKLYASEMGWQAVDAMIQIRGGRGYETAQSLKDRGEKPVPAEQLLRDMRINRIFEGSTEIMHLLIAREALDQHLEVAGDILDPKTSAAGQGEVGGRCGEVLRGLPADPRQRGRAEAQAYVEEFGCSHRTCATSSATRASSRARRWGSWAATRRRWRRRRAARPRRRHRIRSSTRSPARSSTPRRSRSGTPRGARRPSSWPTCSPPRPRGAPS